ncbi:FecR domain-containing protein [Brevundimonas sp. LM2]|uniref:FecR family protein n=1 Tax=Brevundimonas sp. LM2 TaxID=1938605 RepID=UPI0015C54F4D|nr:FecR domain-containing protein [Brevundimonas sp. LM2]
MTVPLDPDLRLNDPADPVAVEATTWFVRLRDQGAGPSDRAAFDAWLQADSAHGTAYADVEALWAGLDGATFPVAVSEPGAGGGLESLRRRTLLSRRAMAAAAALVLTVGVSLPSLATHLATDAQTGVGQSRSLTLADGSLAVLDADSAIAVDIAADRRDVRLLRGRVWVQAAHEARPFRVHVGPAAVRDIGTAFEVSRYGDAGTVAVTEGSVELTLADGPALPLVAGQAARFDRGGAVFAGSAAGTRPAWVPDPTDGQGASPARLRFVDAPLSEVLADLQRHGAGRILVTDAALKRRRITGTVDPAQPRVALNAVLARVDARVDRVGPFVVVRPKSRRGSDEDR